MLTEAIKKALQAVLPKAFISSPPAIVVTVGPKRAAFLAAL
jgi:hypothetical protein